ncbi:MAG: hypothetical protein GWP06_03890 [Actinobacteria bacterium]|nr:hypothetical protein [Actinomycetota bacterium]
MKSTAVYHYNEQAGTAFELSLQPGGEKLLAVANGLLTTKWIPKPNILLTDINTNRSNK